ncbi:MAG: hypothetical protein MI919_23820 [Holophagales bacterium]|nr:hypothetical protein [Holophagales bacterium]
MSSPVSHSLHRATIPLVRRLTVLATLAFAAVPVSAWTTHPPISFQQDAKPLEEVALTVVEATGIEALREESQVLPGRGEAVPYRFATPIAVELRNLQTGTVETLDDGSRLWRLRIDSPGALNLNLTFDEIELAHGAGLWIYSGSLSQVQGPYTRKHVIDGELWSSVVLGDRAVVELYEPAAVAGRSKVKIGRVNHGFRPFGPKVVENRSEEDEKVRGLCNIDVACQEADPWRDQIRSVVAYTINGITACSGSLVNNTAQDGAPYILTAAHCDDTAPGFPGVVTYFNFQTPACGSGSGTLDDTINGATVLYAAPPATTDGALLQLASEPPASYGVHYAGWDVSGTPTLSSVSIHHPSFDEKSISFDDDPTSPDWFYRENELWFWLVEAWDVGTTEGGSSGGPLYDELSGLIVGTLTGGFAACNGTEPNDQPDWYAQLSRYYPEIERYLDKAGTGATQLTGADPEDLDGGACLEDAFTHCLNGDRFQVQVSWNDGNGNSGNGRALAGDSDDSGQFWFFDVSNWEILVKVLDGCALNDNFWVFAAGATDVEYTLTVTDTLAGESQSYSRDLGERSRAITDTSAFATCP